MVMPQHVSVPAYRRKIYVASFLSQFEVRGIFNLYPIGSIELKLEHG